ncbi:MAG TPA: uroporphyrinogen-III synthase [Gemmataceae bacterium]|nr:uroporphyrinogen-III synthase [Gemmataceae bacterium]
MKPALEDRTIALAEGRQLEELAEMLEKEGAAVVRCPLLSILDAPDPAPVVAWLRELVANRFSYVVLLTGEGLRRLLGFAERAGIRAGVIAGLGRVKTVTRGPKPVRALREINLTPTKVAAVPTTDGVIAALRDDALRGQTIGVQLYSDSNTPLTQFLEQAGATVRTVQPYVYAPAVDADRVARLIHQMADGQIDVLVFTSSPQVDRLFEVAREQDLAARLGEGLGRTKIAAVGPIVANNLRQRGARVDICPEQGFVMKNLVQLIKRAFVS